MKNLSGIKFEKKINGAYFLPYMSMINRNAVFLDLFLHVEWRTDDHSNRGGPRFVQGSPSCHVTDSPSDWATVWILCSAEGCVAKICRQTQW